MAVKMGLQSKIVLLVVCGLTTIFAVFSYLGLQTLQESNKRSLDGRLDLAGLIAAHSDEQLRETLSILKNVADPALLDGTTPDGETQRAVLGKLFMRSALFSYAVFVSDEKGQVLWSEPRLRFSPGTAVPGYDALLPGLAELRPQVSDLVIHPQTRVPLVLLTAPIVANGALLGVVGSAADLSVGSLTVLLEPLSLGRTGYAEIVDRGGQVLATTRADRLFLKDDHADRFFTLIRDQKPVVGRCHRCHQESRDARENDVLAFSPMRKAAWGVALRQLEDEVLAPSREMTRRIVLIAVPMFAITLAAAWITTSRVVGPIRVLTEASERIANGDLKFAIRPFGKDELGALADSFATMQIRLKESYEEIEALNRDLEQRVEQRSRDLSTIFEASQIAASSLDVDTLLGKIVVRLVMVIPQAGAAVLYLQSEEDGPLIPRSSYGYNHEHLTRLRLRPDEGIAGKVFRSGQATLWAEQNEVAVAMSDLGEANAACWKEATAATGSPRSAIGVPLVTQGRVIGCLVLDNFQLELGFSDVNLSLAQTIADRIAAAIENARLYEEVQRKEHLRGQLLEKVMVAQEEERRRIARELHDETGQSLTALAIRLASAEDLLPSESGAAKDMLEQAKSLADKLLAEIHRLISDLRPTVLDDLGLVPALRRYSSTHAELLGLDIELHIEGRRRRLAAQVETALFRIVQEAITNVAKHAAAKHVDITLGFEENLVSVVVTDDGRGFDVTQALNGTGAKRGVGLLGMRERVNLLGGTLDITSHSQAGTVLTVSLPLEREEVLAYD